MKKFFTTLFLSGFLVLNSASLALSFDQVKNEIIILPTLISSQTLVAPRGLVSQDRIRSLVTRFVDVGNYRSVRAQYIEAAKGYPAHIIVHLHDLQSHRIQFMAITIDKQFNVLDSEQNYKLTDNDQAHQLGTNAGAKCPDPAVQFVAFAPNQNDLELQITRDVASAARQKGLNTVELLVTDATRQNYFNYMACPNLKGNFYDGDADPTVIVTNDGYISSTELATFRFNHRVTNIWLACKAFNDPMLTSVIKTAESQKYAAGINDLLIGPSDNTGKCAMLAALDGKPMTAAFQACYKQYDTTQDEWGFGGDGSDLFGH